MKLLRISLATLALALATATAALAGGPFGTLTLTTSKGKVEYRSSGIAGIMDKEGSFDIYFKWDTYSCGDKAKDIELMGLTVNADARAFNFKGRLVKGLPKLKEGTPITVKAIGTFNESGKFAETMVTLLRYGSEVRYTLEKDLDLTLVNPSYAKQLGIKTPAKLSATQVSAIR